MTTKVATTTFTTELTNLPDGITPQDGFLVELFHDGNVTTSTTVPDSSSVVEFTLTEPGVYYVVVSKLDTDNGIIGEAQSDEFTLDQDQVEVPVSVSVSLSDVVEAPNKVKVVVR